MDSEMDLLKQELNFYKNAFLEIKKAVRLKILNDLTFFDAEFNF